MMTGMTNRTVFDNPFVEALYELTRMAIRKSSDTPPFEGTLNSGAPIQAALEDGWDYLVVGGVDSPHKFREADVKALMAELAKRPKH